MDIMDFRLNPRVRRRLVLILVAFLVLHLAASLLIQEYLLRNAPVSMRGIIRLSSVASAFTISAGALAVLSMAILMGWSVLTLIDVKMETETLLSSAILLLAVFSGYEFARLILAWTLLPQAIKNIEPTIGLEGYLVFLQKILALSRWSIWQSRLDAMFLIICPVIFGAGLNYHKKMGWLVALIMAASVELALLISRWLEQIVDSRNFLTKGIWP